MPATTPEVLALDAMGVIYAEGHDVQKLIAPFVRDHGGTRDLDEVEDAYMEASFGHIGPEDFWQRVGLSPDLEDECLALHRLSDGILELLERAPARYQRVVCLSNDVARWSRKLRQMFSLEPLVSAWFISAEIGLRKPDPAIYRYLLEQLDVAAEQVVFVDDRTKNLDPAKALGIQTVHYNTTGAGSSGAHRTIDRLTALLES